MIRDKQLIKAQYSLVLKVGKDTEPSNISDILKRLDGLYRPFIFETHKNILKNQTDANLEHFCIIPDSLNKIDRLPELIKWLDKQAFEKNGCETKGVLFLSTPINIPKALDIRFLSFNQNAELASISPLCNTYEITSWIQNLYGQKGKSYADCLDKAFFFGTDHNFYPVPIYFKDCFFLTSSGKKALITLNKKDCSSHFSISKALSVRGLQHLVCEGIYVEKPNSNNCKLSYRINKKELPYEIRRSRDHHPITKILPQIANLKNQKEWHHISYPGLENRPVQLHISHGFGGGLGKWVSDFIKSDKERINLLLKPIGDLDAFCQRLELYAHPTHTYPIRSYQLSVPIRSCTISSIEYKKIIHDIIKSFQVEAIYVSSLIGHSLDILDTSIPTILVCHDYFPLCPTCTLYFNAVCTKCTEKRLEQCLAENPMNFFMNDLNASHWKILQKAYIKKINDNKLRLVAPTPSVVKNFLTLCPELDSERFHVISHGIDKSFLSFIDQKIPENTKIHELDILILGRMCHFKGSELLKDSLGELLKMGRLHLIGCGGEEEFFLNNPKINVIKRYNPEELHSIIEKIKPHIALLLSIVPETYSYTLTELMAMGIPTVATRLGSFEDRIIHGKTGWLIDPNPSSLLQMIHHLKEHPLEIKKVKENLKKMHIKTLEEMVGQYHALLPLKVDLKKFVIPKDVKLSFVTFCENSSSREISTNLTISEYMKASIKYFLYKIDHTPKLSNWQKRLIKKFLPN